MAESSPSWLRNTRAFILLLVIVVHGIFAAPLPRAVKLRDMQRPAGVEEIDRWLSLFASVGFTPARKDFEAWVVDSTSFWGGWHEAFKKPFRPVMRMTGTGQGWALFAAPDTHPHRLEVFVRVGGDWSLIYRRFHPQASWNDGIFRFRRVRGVYDSSTQRQLPSYKAFSAWVAEQALADYPQATGAKVQMVRTHTTVPGEPRDPKEEPRQVIVIMRDLPPSTP